jgi:hypothetical protein
MDITKKNNNFLNASIFKVEEIARIAVENNRNKKDLIKKMFDLQKETLISKASLSISHSLGKL